MHGSAITRVGRRGRGSGLAMAVVAFGLALACCCCTLQVAAKVESHLVYESLCQNGEEPLIRISEARALIEFVKSAESQAVGCDPRIRQAILDLELALEVDDPDNYCTAQRVDRITAYIAKHIKAPEPVEEIPEPEPPKYLPKALKRFFIGFSLDVSKICKLGMLKLLMKDSKDLVTPDDHKEILRWTNGGDEASKKFLGRAINYDDMFLVGSAICDSGSKNSCRKLYVQTEYWKKLREMRITCHRVFKPFYSTLIMPIVRLANFGIDYQGDDLEEKLDDFREDPKLQNWYKIVFLCESMLNVIPLDLPKEEQEPEFLVDENVLTKLDQEELDEEIEEHEELEGEEVIVAELDEACELDQPDGSSELQLNEQKKLQLGEDEVLDCKDGKKVIKKKVTNKAETPDKKIKKKGDFLTKFGKDIVKEMRKLQRERKAYILSRKNMPVTNIMLKKDVELYEQEHGPIDENDFGDKAPIDYKPRPQIRLADLLLSPEDKRISKAIKQYETKKRNYMKTLGKLTKKYVRLFRRVFFLGRVKFGGKSKEEISTDELMFKVFDKAMWKKDNHELVHSTYGKFRTFMDFQNISNLATWISLIAGVIFFALSTAGVCAG